MKYEGIIFSDNLDELITSNTVEDAEQLLILRCIKGKLKVELNNGHYTLNANNLMVCMPDFLFGHYMHTPDFECEVIAFKTEVLRDVVHECLLEDERWWEKAQYLNRHPIIELNKRQIELVNAFNQLRSIYGKYENTPTRTRVVNILIQGCLTEMLSWVEDLIEPIKKGEYAYSRKHVIFNHFLELLTRTRGTRREVQWFADQLSISPKYLSAVCNEVRGRNASALIDEVTVHELKRLLRQTDLSAKEISARMQFSNFSFFCKYAHKHLGMSITQFRRTSH